MSFGVSGLLWNRSLVMYDKETGSLWSHILGESMQGELKGTKLEALSTELMTWESWRTAHPDTDVMALSRVTRFVDRGFDHSKSFYREPEHWSYGWSVGLRRYHVTMAELQKQPVMNLTLPGANLVVAYDPESTDINLYTRRAGDRDLTFVAAGPGRMRDEQTGSVWDPTTGEAIEGRLRGQRLPTYLGMISYTNAWESFYPTSRRLPEPSTN